MSTILVYTSPARGHLFPILGTALDLGGRGHRVHVRTLSDEVERVRTLGLEAEPIDPAVEGRELDDWRARNPMQALELAMTTFADRAPAEVDDLQGAVAEIAPDALVVDTNSWGAQAVAEASGLPWATFQPYFTALPSPGVPPFGPGFRPSSGPFGTLRDHLVGRLVAAKTAKAALPGINAPRRRLGLESLQSMDEFLLRPPQVLYFTAPELEYPREHWPESFHFVGPGTWNPPAEEPERPAGVDRPIVLVTCSTEKQEDRAILEAALEGLPGAGYYVVATSGAFSPEEIAAEPSPHVRLERFIPHDAVLPEAAAVVCHGGMGITQRALANGVPVVVVPFGRDQLEVAGRVEQAGAGVRVPSKRLTPQRLASAVQDARKLQAGARRMAEAFAAAGAGGAAADVVEGMLSGRNSPTG